MIVQKIDSNKIIEYIKTIAILGNIDHYDDINVGSGGAQLFIVVDRKGDRYVIKNSGLNKDSSLLKEYKFYEINRKNKFSFVPETIHTEIHSEYGVIIVMKMYKHIKYDEWDHNLQLKAVDLCAMINSIDKNYFFDLDLKQNLITLNEDFLLRSYKDWIFVINQHNVIHGEKIIDEIYKNLDIVCPILNNGNQYICHGDFHPENILIDNEDFIICDWQNVKIGKGIGDVSFFVDRAHGFGIHVDSEKIIDNYCLCLSKYIGKTIDKKNILQEQSAAALKNIFSYWAEYLKDCSWEKVYPLYQKMVNAYKLLIYVK